MDPPMQELVLRRSDDWHLHLRDGDMLSAVTPRSSAYFARAIIMPNLMPPVTDTEMAAAYRRASSTPSRAATTLPP